MGKKILYCLCRREKSGFMIACDKCNNWFHGKCLDITEKQAKELPSWYCICCDQVVKCEEQMERMETKLKESIDELKTDIANLKMENVKLRSNSQVEGNEVLVKLLREETSKLKADYENKSKENTNLLAQVNQMTQETEKLTSKFQKIIESKADSIRHLQEECSKLEEACVKKTEENNNLFGQVNQLTQENIKLRSKCQEFNKIQDLRKQSQEGNSKLRRELESKTQEIKVIQVNQLTNVNKFKKNKLSLKRDNNNQSFKETCSQQDSAQSNASQPKTKRSKMYIDDED